ncbi:DUF418 domain-containing protein [Nonomuraea jiangxiensis]|uniref:DUF418 domain-containing protein n=1 Tax=Nonomuraea jiangxiensis TaxID=633440 RepID=UPI001FE8C382|nr:DUF418 domain-containing protein [Nonomuraea jiangxiensis]
MTRIRELDALRGFAVGGIMLVNTWQHTVETLGDHRVPLDGAIEALFQSRFYPIFSLLFGISFLLFLRGNSRWALLSRLFWLFVFGLVQHTFYEGEVLTDYAFYGALVLLPASFMAAGWPVLTLGLAVLAWGMLVGGGVWLIPGLFLIGMALWQLHPPRSLLFPGFAVAALAGVLLIGAWIGTNEWWVYSVAGLAGAAAYSLGLLLVLRPRLSAVLEPLGKMALTNYVWGTAIIAVAVPVLVRDPTRWSVVGLTVVTLAVQIVFARWWLARFRYGPLEWLWRCLTFYRWVPNRLESGRDQNRPLPDPGVP